MTFDWNVRVYDYNDRIKNLSAMAKGKVKSNKFFPVFIEDGKEKVLKPLSKTKPFTTPYFAYSEVFWSTITAKYFDKDTPIYQLAICDNIGEAMESKYPQGTIVDSLQKPGYRLINLYEIFTEHKDSAVNIEDYVNFCMKFYDYTFIFDSKLMKENESLSRKLATQILLSILKIDQNYHYENPLFYEKDGIITDIAPMIDHEFSTMFLFPEDENENVKHFNSGIESLVMPKNDPSDIFVQLRYEAFATFSKNLDIIIERYPETAEKFLENLNCFIRDFQKEPLLFENHNYITPFNSSNFMIGHALYKENDIEKANKLRNRLEQYYPSIEEISSKIYLQVLTSSITLEQEMEKRLVK